jgi:glutathione reductase (NADPH)
MAQYDYDLFVIGGGSGGVRASRMAALAGKKVAIAEEYRLGGTCVIRGCIPKKLFVYAAQFHEDFMDSAAYGWTIGEPSFDWPTLIANKDKEIARLEGMYQKNVLAAGVTIFQDRAVLEDAHTIRLLNGELCITSNEAFHLDKLPGRILIAGGGYIAMEFAHIFHGLGSKVSVLYRGEKVLRGFDEDIRDALRDNMVKKGLHVSLGCEFTKIEKRGDCLYAETNKGDKIACDQIMLAIGRAPNTEALHVEKAGVELGRRGEVLVDRYSKTSAGNIYAIGDVTDRIQLTPVAIHEAMCFVKTVFGGQPTPADHEDIATAVFTTPEIGVVGMTELRALGLGHHIDVYKSVFHPLKHTLSGRDERSTFKLIVDSRTDKVLGCHIFGDHAAEIIQIVGILVKMGATKSQFDATVALHPSAAEELVTMRTKSYSKSPES